MVSPPAFACSGSFALGIRLVRAIPEKIAALFFLPLLRLRTIFYGALPHAPPPFEKGGRKLYIFRDHQKPLAP